MIELWIEGTHVANVNTVKDALNVATHPDRPQEIRDAQGAGSCSIEVIDRSNSSEGIVVKRLAKLHVSVGWVILDVSGPLVRPDMIPES